MSTIKILVRGYAKEKKGVEFASSTVTLIQEKNVNPHTKDFGAGINIVVDPGMDRQSLLKGLKRAKLSPEKIHYIILTHYHLDHALLTAIFQKAQVWDDSNVYSWDGKIGEHKGKIPGTDVKLIKTSGHDPFHCSVLVKTKEWGKVVIAGDLFWWQEGQKQEKTSAALLDHKDPYMKDKKALLSSRKKILALADYIIPGHGKMFKIPEK